jgi:hypothetical protein
VVKAIRVSLVLMLLMPATVMAQSATPLADRIATVRFLRPGTSSIDRNTSVTPKPLRPAMAMPAGTTSVTQPASGRSWAGRHPAALGAMIGAAAGALVGAVPCWKEVCGDGHGPLIVALGAGIGAGVGAGVGFAISLAQR